MSKEVIKKEFTQEDIITADDLVLVEKNVLNNQQLQMIMGHTPAKFVRQRPAKGGGTWNYVSGGYVQKALNIAFGWNWDFEIVSEHTFDSEVVVKGRLTCRANGNTIVKTQYGNKDIMKRKGSNEPLSIGNDMKAAATDALKKCAQQIGIAADVYTPDDFEASSVGEVKPMKLTPKFNKWADVVAWVGKGGKRSDLAKKYLVTDEVWVQLLNESKEAN